MAILNFLTWGATFLNREVASYADENLLIGYTGQEMLPITGALVDSAPLLDANKVKITSEQFTFLIETSQLIATGLTIQRGLEIVKDEVIYEVIISPKGSREYNDPAQLRTVIMCTKKDPS